MIQSEYVRASDIGEYIFCKRGWWLRANGKLAVTEQMRQGTVAHDDLARGLRRFTVKKIVAWSLVGVGIVLILLFAVSLIYFFLGFLL